MYASHFIFSSGLLPKMPIYHKEMQKKCNAKWTDIERWLTDRCSHIICFTSMSVCIYVDTWVDISPSN